MKFDARAEADRLFDDVLLVAVDEIGRADASAALERAYAAGLERAEEIARADGGKWRGPAGEACTEGANAAANAIAAERERAKETT